MDSSSPTPKRKIDEIYSSEESTCESESESEMQRYEEKAYQKLQNGLVIVAESNSMYKCPYCVCKKTKNYAYDHDHLVQHAKDSGKMRSSLKFRGKSNHRALARYLENKSAKEFSRGVGSSSIVAGEKKFVYQWKVVVVSKVIDISNKAIKEQLVGFKPVKVRTIWGPEYTPTGQAIVDFTEDWLGFNHAMSLESEYNCNQFGEKKYALDNLGGLVKEGLYAWVAKEDDYYSECLVGKNLRNSSSALKTIEDIEADNEMPHNQKVSQLNDLIKKKNDALVNGQVMV
ncbi:factor of DNA methylation 4-like [Papaver somniferum]|uniref:factor of DNA methylation 4-like n=1 Tax=Papaver somniferum TaxID=3469 RepID=UPI000E7015EF|nr:factor of DNA methylation 4-like [Papaver somniferum]